MKKSVWSETKLPRFECLEGDKKCDVLIVGGGMAGNLCAYKLHNQGVDYILLEGGRIAEGVTKNTTAKITSQHALIYSKMDKIKGRAYLLANEEALEEYRKLCKNIDCDFETKDAYTYTIKHPWKIEREVQRLKDIGFNCEFTKGTELPFNVKGAVKFPNQAQFNPVKFIKGICEKLNIYENTFVERIEDNTAITKNGKVKAEKIIIATHFPFINTHGSYFLKLYQHRSYVCAFENAPYVHGMYVDEDKKGMSFRMYNDLLLIGGGSHRTGERGGGWEEIISFAKKYYPEAKLKYMWATQDTMSLDSIPYIGNYSKNTPNMYVATGFNKWGMTGSMVSASVLCDLVMEKRSEYSELFSPSRSILKPQLALNGFETTKNLLTPTVRRCTHLGCALKWNKYEHTWDCPCHGSRFNEEGYVIDNPAIRPLK